MWFCHAGAITRTERRFTALTIFCRKMEQERHIPFEITAEADPFYSESNVRVLKGRLDDIKSGKVKFEEHELIEVD